MPEFDAIQLREFITQLLMKHKAAEADARVAADAYVSANLFGLASHGVMRVLRIIDGVKAGTHFLDKTPTIERELPSALVVNGNSALGVSTAHFALTKAIEKAKQTGIACATVHNSNHFGMAGFYVREAAKEGMVAFAFCNASPGVAAPGGKKKVIGTNPIAFGAPTRGDPIALDMSIAAVVRGKALEFERQGKDLPDGVAIDSDGNPTTNPTEALKGAFLPYGGVQSYKSMGLGVMIDILSGPFAGAMFGDKVTGSANTKEDCTKGDCFIVMDVSKFREMKSFLDDMDEFKRIVKASGDNVILPGEIEKMRESGMNGKVTLDDDLVAKFTAASAEVELDMQAFFV